jgi:hypothetical protein
MSGRNECNENQNEQKTFHERSKWLGGQSIGLIVSVYLEVLDLFPSSRRLATSPRGDVKVSRMWRIVFFGPRLGIPGSP